MQNVATEWRIVAPRPGRPDWTIVVTTVDELGRSRIEGKGKSYDEAQAETKKKVEQRQQQRAEHMAQMGRDYAVLGQLSASNFNEEEG